MYRFSLSALSRAGSLIVATLIAVQGGLALAAAPHEREASVSRQDQVTVDGKTLGYTATAGKLLVFDADRNPAAEIFYIAYTLNDTDAGERPITFVWDGGPGGATIAGNYLGLGPKRYFPSEHENAGPPYRASPNPHTLLAHSDLVFLDPVGTGYSRALGDWQDRDFWGVEADAEATHSAIVRYLSLNHRWQSPKFLLGTSYGTTRASVVAHRLQAYGAALNGVVLVASALNYGMFDNGMDQQFMLSLPTLAATAWHFGKTAHQSLPLPEFLDEVQHFVRTEYGPALYLGNALPEAQRIALAEKLSGYLGLRPQYILDANLRVSVIRFRKELLRQDGIVLGRMDGRTTMHDFDRVGEEPENDYWLSEEFAMPARAILEDFLGRELGYDPGQDYALGSGDAIQAWNWAHRPPPFAGVSQREYDERNLFPQNTWPAADLSVAMRTNRNLRVFQAHGYFDFATPYAWADYDLAHMTYDPQVMSRITTRYYKAGHVVFYDEKVLPKLHEDLGTFYRQALVKANPPQR